MSVDLGVSEGGAVRRVEEVELDRHPDEKIGLLRLLDFLLPVSFGCARSVILRENIVRHRLTPCRRAGSRETFW